MLDADFEERGHGLFYASQALVGALDLSTHPTFARGIFPLRTGLPLFSLIIFDFFKLEVKASSGPNGHTECNGHLQLFLANANVIMTFLNTSY